MVTKERKRKFVAIEYIEEIAGEKPNMTSKELITELHKLPTRQPKPEAPEGGISLSEAERKYKIPNETIYRWVSRGYIPVLLRTKREVYISEKDLAEIAKIYNTEPGRGSWVVKRNLIQDKDKAANSAH